MGDDLGGSGLLKGQNGAPRVVNKSNILVILSDEKMWKKGARCAFFLSLCWFLHWVTANEFSKRAEVKTYIKSRLILKNSDFCTANLQTILHCQFASQFWSRIGITVHQASVEQLWLLPRPTGVPAQHYHTFLLLCAWQLWKHRHDVIFRSQDPSLLRLLLSCKEEARLWSCRLPQQDKSVAESWCSIFCSNM